jgi:hypothetical protein
LKFGAPKKTKGIQSPPFKKGNLEGFQALRKSPLTPLFPRGGLKMLPISLKTYFLQPLVRTRKAVTSKMISALPE